MIRLGFYLGTRAENPDHSHLADRLICAWTRSRFSHVELVEFESESGLSHCWGASPRDGQVRSTWIDLRSGRWVLGDLPGDQLRAAWWFAKHRGMPYDWQGVFSHVLPFIPDDPTKAYCSKAIALAAGMSDTKKTPEDIWRLAVPVR